MGGEKLNAGSKYFTAVLITVFLILFSFPAFSQTADTPLSEETIILGDPLPQVAQSGGASVWIVLRMVLILALAALAIYGVVFFIKRLAKPPQARDPHLKVLASVPLGGDTFAAVLSVGSRAWLVGGGSSAGLSLIAEIDESEALESMLLDDARKSAETGPARFLDFRSLLNRLGKGVPADRDLGSHADSLRKQRDRLKGL